MAAVFSGEGGKGRVVSRLSPKFRTPRKARGAGNRNLGEGEYQVWMK